MSWWSRLRNAIYARPLDESLEDEIQDHLERRAAAFRAEGLPPDEARRRALSAFGNVTRVREQSREIRLWPGLESTIQDARYAWRTMRRSPAFTITALHVAESGDRGEHGDLRDRRCGHAAPPACAGRKQGVHARGASPRRWRHRRVRRDRVVQLPAVSPPCERPPEIQRTWWPSVPPIRPRCKARIRRRPSSGQGSSSFLERHSRCFASRPRWAGSSRVMTIAPLAFRGVPS